MKGILYKITFPNNKSYIGITSRSLKRRVIHHCSFAKTGKCSFPLQRAILKYGKNSFKAEILVICDDWKYLCDLEIRAIQKFKTLIPHGYNVALGGDAPSLGRKQTEQQKLQQSRRAKKRAKIKNGLPGHIGNKATLNCKHTPEAIAKIAEAGIDRIFTAEARAKIGASKIGNKNCLGRVVTEKEKRKIRAGNLGKFVSEETRIKQSKAKQGKPWSAARRAACKN